MAFFVKLYDNSENSIYHGIIEENDALHFDVVGSIGDHGLFTQLDENGTPTSNFRYRIQGEKILFRTGVQTENGDFLLYGTMLTSNKNRNKNLVIRTNDRGDVLWAKTYTQTKTRYNIHLVKSVNDTYFMSSWLNSSGSSDDVEIIKIDGSGNVLHAVNIVSNSDDQVNKLVPFGNGVLVFGGTSAGPGWDNFMVAFDANLGVLWKKLIGANGFQEVRDVEVIDSTHFVLTGETGGKKNSFIFKYDLSQSSHSADVYDFVGGKEDGFKQLIQTPTNFYLCAFTNAAKASFVAKFDHALALDWVKEISLDEDVILRDIDGVGSANDQLLVIGNAENGNSLYPMVVHSDADLNSCATVELPLPIRETEIFKSTDWNTVFRTTTITVASYDVIKEPVLSIELKKCPSDNLDLNGNILIQSPYIYLQAAGSDESDDSVRGFHLRWDLLKKLGETHLPKGDYAAPTGAYPTTIGYNRPDDFVRIYKTPFKKDYAVEIDLNDIPSSFIESGATREWTYQNLVPINTLPTNLTDVVLRFADVSQYDSLRLSIDPTVDPLDFIKNYTGIIEAQTVGKFMFLVEFKLGVQINSQSDALRYETISLNDTSDASSQAISCRKTISKDTNEVIYCENVEYIRFDYENAFPKKIKFSTYDDFILGSNSKGDWSLLGEFALDDGNSDTSANVFKRLEDSAAYTIHNKWRKYNEPDVNNAGEFRVNIANYQDKWTMADGLKQAVETYLDVSKTDLQAVVTHTNSDPIVNDSEMDISYLDMLNFVSIDYHVARMLGLGHIDHDASVKDNKEFVYLMQYVTNAQLENESPALTVQHFYMTPPLSIVDYKLPQVPVQDDLTYGIYVNNHTGSPSLLTNPAGYNPYGPSRYIQINRAPFNFERPLENFYQSGIEYCLCEEAVPVLLGLEYADDTIVIGNPFKRPEITHDVDHLDPGGLPEVTAIPLTENGMVYIHEETNEGIHHYGLYSINWFSRVSPVGNKKETDYTEFPKLNTLLPPSNLAVQLIQKEVPLIFTTAQEQADLLAISDPDKTYVRITFDWNEIHNKAYQTGDGVEIFWRQDEPSIIQGEIQTGPGAVIEDPLTHTVLVQTTGYYNASVNQTITPEVIPGQEAIFEGARLTVGGQSYQIEEVVTSGVNPSFRLSQIRQTASQDVNNNNVFCTTETWISPDEGERFLVSENLDNSASWDEQLAATVSLEQFSNHTETVSYDDGTTKTFTIGGLTGSAVIADIPDPDPNIVVDHVPPGGPTQVPTGVYTITYDSELLPPHPNGDPNAIVDYIRGTVRLLDANNEIKTLNVWKVEEVAGVTVLTAFDPTFGLERDANDDFVLTSSQFTPLAGYTPIQTGSVPFVNYHPSYRVYVYHGTGGSTFIDTNILPVEGEGTHNTFMAVRSVDSTITPTPCRSFMSPPAVLMAREISEPVPPGIPQGPLFATRPNFYGKATYTFDVAVENPFSLIFFRANERKILDQLYTPATADQIIEDLANLPEPDFGFNQSRWNELVNMIIDPFTFTFNEYTAGGYRFPMPNNALYKIPHANPVVQEFPFTSTFVFSDNYTYTDPDLGTVTVSMFDLVKDCIDGAFLPLTEIPAVYKQLQESEFETSGKKPVLRNPQTGARYTTDDPEFDPWPMAFRFEKNVSGDVMQSGDAGYGTGGNLKYVRFTDYTLDGASKNFYFYFAVELSNTLAVSDRSLVAGPIQLVNSAPAVAPEIKKTETQLYNLQNRIPTAVGFELNEFVTSENIKQFQIYRAIKPEDSLSVRSMELAKTVNVGEEVKDDFSDKLFPLYGEPLFYRIVALREIVNEQGATEMVPSQASNVVLTNVVDNVNPTAPDLIISHDPATGSPLQISNVTIEFSQSTYNAIYRLYKQNSKGNWVLLHDVSPALHQNLPTISIALVNTSLGSGILNKQTVDLNPIYHRFRVDVENSSGLFNLKNKEFTV